MLAAYSMAAVKSIMRGRLQLHHIVMFTLGWMALAFLLALYLLDERAMDPVFRMIVNATVNKSVSASAIERGMWNAQSIQNFIDTFGIGVGLGSTRSSSWPISVIAQMGVIGGVGFLIALAAVAIGPLRLREPGIGALAACVSAAALAWVSGASLSGSGADPNMIFFVALAAVSASLARTRPASGSLSGSSDPRLASLRNL
jgi:hypothetical protein